MVAEMVVANRDNQSKCDHIAGALERVAKISEPAQDERSRHCLQRVPEGNAKSEGRRGICDERADEDPQGDTRPKLDTENEQCRDGDACGGPDRAGVSLDECH